MDIKHEQSQTKGSYSYRSEPDGPVAELTYSRAGDTMIIIDHTDVPDAYRGQKVGVALVERAVKDAREHGWTVVPLCPFAAAQFRRRPDWADVLASHLRPKQ